ncbi:acyl-CoA dehydrogenase family protein [Variovorax sp. PBL-E5]|uniref:acyl-CoA dehydrogenase family protein n=1 Tax=Variovorax sp. PBL-E5 TaxID=434014 RepID=UPI001317DED6|nr:acyl-CoA dehydrogenase family protein [Variovorax sp. PBL-E5]VTU46096.1 Acyl-CoA dehydrogenase [Variovorax sp. PBL-E5]
MNEQAAATDWNGLDDEHFRARAAAFFDANCPAALRHRPKRLRWHLVKPWFMTLSQQGWVAPSWPVEWGGMGLSPVKQLIYIEEYERSGAPVMQTQSLTNFGPILIARGTEAQRRKYLPRILSGEDVWVQGYSEPNAGSDLASLRTEARLEGDEFIINGQKIWTTMGFDGTHMFALVRTDKTVRKQAGISFVLFPMDQPGITVRPIRDISGGEEFCEVFLEDVRAHRSDVVGELHGGWNIAKTLLGFERVWSGSPRQSLIALARLEKVARANGAWTDPVFQDRYTQLLFDVRDLAAMYERLVHSLSLGKGFGLESSLLKMTATETCQRVTELLVETSGQDGATEGAVDVGGESIDLLTPFLESRGPTIYGGSNQIQRNILARQWLELPE